MAESEDPDPLYKVAKALRDALLPFGIGVRPDLLTFWDTAQALGEGPFTASHEFNPVLVKALEGAVALMRESAADEPEDGPDGS
jgi:hypothetical protein